MLWDWIGGKCYRFFCLFSLSVVSLFSENEKIGCFGEVERGRNGGRESVVVWKERKNQIKVGQKKVDEIGLKLRKVLSVWREEEE